MSTQHPSHARVVIIGGGVIGCSIAYHLTMLGWTDVVLVERNELTSGSTFHSAGLFRLLTSDVNLTQMLRYSKELYMRLGDETDHDPAWREVGSLRLASSRQRQEEHRRQYTLFHSYGVPLQLVSPTEAQELFPLIDLDGVLGGLYVPSDGYLDPNGVTMALAAGARERGTKILTNTFVEEILLVNNRVDTVVTDHGNIKTEIVINAAGMWANEIGRMVGLDLPVIPMIHRYLITKPIEGVQRNFPALRDPDLLLYFREEMGGLIVGGYERTPKSWGLDGIPRDFNYTLLPPDWDQFMPLMESAVKRVPSLQQAEIVQLIDGPEGFTPDGEPMLGPTGVKGFWVAAAFCAHGLALAGGVGKALAEWIIQGRPEWDVWRLDVRRFGSEYQSSAFTQARVIEAYSKHYDIIYPHEERLSARLLRTSPTYECLKGLGAVFGEKAGWERPNWFSTNELRIAHGYRPAGWAGVNWSPAIGVEHIGTREGAGLFDLSSFGKLEIFGPDALTFLQYLCANNVDRPVGSVVYTSMLNQNGGIECDITITRLGVDRFRIITGTALLQHDLAWISVNRPERYSIQIEDVTSSLACIALWGPQSRSILRRVTQDDISNEGVPYLTARNITVGDVPVLGLRVSYVGELGWEFYCQTECAQRLWEVLWEAGQPAGLIPAGYRAIDSLRVEKGYRSWGADIGPQYTPFQAGLGFAVKLNKGDFIGKRALLEQKEVGINQKLCCLTVNDKTAIVTRNDPIRDRSNRVIGRVTSGAYGYSVANSIAYTYLPMAFTKVGTRLEVQVEGEPVEAIVSSEPLWDPDGNRITS